MRTVEACHKSRSANPLLLATDCNDVDAADAKGLLAPARITAAASIDKACDGASSAVLKLYPRCPSPVISSDDGGATPGIDDLEELSACLIALSDAYVSRIGKEIQGYPAAILSSAHRDCQAAIGKAAAKAMRTAARERGRCQADQEKGNGGLSYAACAGDAGDADGRIARALDALDARIAKSCAFEDGHAIGSCGFDTASLQSCVRGRVVEPLSGGLVAAAEEFPGTCPSFARYTVQAGTGPSLSATRIDLGYTGSAHDMDAPDGLSGAVNLSGCNEDCGNCAVTLDRTGGSCRCDADATIECSTIGGPDPACDGGTCHCMIGPPEPRTIAGVPLCVVHRVESDFNGDADADGSYEVGVQLGDVIHTGIDFVQPCPICTGDAQRDDGNRDGTCAGGPRNGQACDANGNHPTYGAASMDCPPPSAAAIGTQKLQLVFGSGAQSLTASITDPSQCDDAACHCGECSGDPTVACSDDSECIVAGAGSCSATARVSRADACNTTCTPAGDGMGVCDGPVDSFCNGVLTASGAGIVPCSNNSDCLAVSSSCGESGCGSCSLSQPRSCFLPAITAEGTNEVFGGEGVSIFCMPSVSPSTVHGFPGPGRVKLDLDLYCADGSTRFELPGGSGCP